MLRVTIEAQNPFKGNHGKGWQPLLLPLQIRVRNMSSHGQFYQPSLASSTHPTLNSRFPEKE